MLNQAIRILTCIAVGLALSFSFSSQSVADWAWENKAPLPNPRRVEAVGVINGKIYAPGGYFTLNPTTFHSVLDIYDPPTDTWSRGTASITRRSTGGVAVIAGKLYAAGGCIGTTATGPDCSAGITNLLEVYDPAVGSGGTWTTLPGMPGGARAAVTAAAIGGKLYVLGGFFAGFNTTGLLEVYDPADGPDGTWSTLAPMCTARESMKVAVIDEKLHVIGGFVRTPAQANITTLEVYDPLANSWATSDSTKSASCPVTLTAMQLERANLAAAASDGLLHAVGGINNSGPDATLERYNPAVEGTGPDPWTTLTPMPTERWAHAVAGIGSKLYVMGGNAIAGPVVDTLEVFTPGPCEIPPPGLLSWWDGDSVNGSTVVDMLGKQDGTLTDGATTAPGQIGTAFSFDGSDDYIQLPFTPDVFTTTNQFTLESWFFPTKHNSSAINQAIIGNDTGGNRGLALLFGISTDEVSCNVKTETASERLFVVQAGVSLNAWHHAACTYDGSTLTLYLEGVAIGSSTTIDNGNIHNNLVPFRIGHDQFDGSSLRYFGGKIDEPSIYDTALTAEQVEGIFNIGADGKCISPANAAPTADAGANQSIHVGVSVNLDGNGSSDDNTASEDLLYAWSFDTVPVGSGAALVGDASITPSFIPDLAGDYVVSLVVTDEGGLSSTPDMVTVSSLNSAPNANAGNDQGAVVNALVILDGLGSNDPDDDPLSFAWTLISVPVGSTAVLIDDNTDSASVVPDLPGAYSIQLVVNDGFVDSTPDVATITVITAEDFAEMNTVESINIVVALPPSSVTTTGNQQALGNSLSQVITSLQDGNVTKAIKKLEQAIARTDGCALRGSPDTGGGGGGNPPEKDYVASCADQAMVYPLLVDALAVLSL